jgi:hypothetical protein
MYAFQIPTELPSRAHATDKGILCTYTRRLDDVAKNSVEDDVKSDTNNIDEANNCMDLHKSAKQMYADALEMDRSGCVLQAESRYKDCLKKFNDCLKFKCDGDHCDNLRWREVVHCQRHCRQVKSQISRRLREIDMLKLTDFMVWEKTPEIKGKCEKVLSLKCGAFVFKLSVKCVSGKSKGFNASMNYRTMPVTLVKFPSNYNNYINNGQ